MKRKNMSGVLLFWLPIIGGILLGGFGCNAWYGGSKSLGLWLSFAGLLCFLLLGALQIQEAIWKNDAKPVKSNDPDRPWISVGDPIIASPLRFLAAGATVTLRFLVKNSGKSPAVNVSFQVQLIPMTPERSAPHLEQERFVAELKAKPDILVFGERSVFQGDSVAVEQSFLVPRAEIEQAAKLFEPHGQTNTFLPILVACAVYKFSHEGERHYTCIVGDIHKRDPQTHGLSIPFDITAGDVPINQMESVQLYAGYVD
jgi:hypothetical protein